MSDVPSQSITDEEVVADEPQLAQPSATADEPVEPETPTQEPEAPAEEPESAPSGEEEAAAPPSRREQLRIQQLLQKYGPPPERPTSQQPSQSNRQDALDYSQALDADPETIQAFENDRQRAAQAQYIQGQNEGLQRAEFLNWNTSLKIEAPVIEKKYPMLDKNSPDFHPAVADALNSWYLKMSGFDAQRGTVSNPDISYADFVESNMELVEEIAGNKNAQTVKNVARQAAATGLRPDGSSAKRMNLNQAPDKMTLDELYAASGLPDTRPKK
jgi:hypothetical protein